MAETSLDKALESLNQAADAVRQAAENAGGLGDAAAAAAHAASGGAIDPFVFRFAIFILSIFVGYYVVWSVTPALHTPLMAVTNAVSGIIVVGAMLQAVTFDGQITLTTVLGAVAVLLASINIFGGFAVTERMLDMFKKKKK